MSKISIEDYNYSLPSELIAQRPASPRDHARLLVYRRSDKSIIDDHFYNLDKHLFPNTTLVLNNSQVDKVRLKFGKLEVFVTKQLKPNQVQAMVFPGKKFPSRATVKCAPGVLVTVDRVLDDGQRVLSFSLNLGNSRLDEYRNTPFPPYITPDEKLANEYQTVFAKHRGSAAAPTAGLHFTAQQLDQLKKTHNVVEVTLHVGLGTFAPLKAHHIRNEKLHQELYEINDDSAKQLNRSTHITAVGTTSTRVLESAVQCDKHFVPRVDCTDMFIFPGYEFKAVDSLITNFHLPKSSLLMLVAAFMGREEMLRVYKHAVDNEYRFFSFGDVMLVL